MYVCQPHWTEDSQYECPPSPSKYGRVREASERSNVERALSAVAQAYAERAHPGQTVHSLKDRIWRNRNRSAVHRGLATIACPNDVKQEVVTHVRLHPHQHSETRYVAPDAKGSQASTTSQISYHIICHDTTWLIRATLEWIQYL